jgi:hypothetical protein
VFSSLPPPNYMKAVLVLMSRRRLLDRREDGYLNQWSMRNFPRSRGSPKLASRTYNSGVATNALCLVQALPHILDRRGQIFAFRCRQTAKNSFAVSVRLRTGRQSRANRPTVKFKVSIAADEASRDSVTTLVDTLDIAVTGNVAIRRHTDSCPQLNTSLVIFF